MIGGESGISAWSRLNADDYPCYFVETLAFITVCAMAKLTIYIGAKRGQVTQMHIAMLLTVIKLFIATIILCIVDDDNVHVAVYSRGWQFTHNLEALLLAYCELSVIIFCA